MRGRLKHLTLKIIEKEPSSGSEIIHLIEKEYSWKPSYGSIYPLLENLKEEKLVTSKKEKRKIIYSITRKGKKELSKYDQEKQELIQNVKKVHNVMSKVYGMNVDYENVLVDELEKGNVPFKEIQKESNDMKKVLFELYKTKKYKEKQKTIKQILQKAIKELKKL